MKQLLSILLVISMLISSLPLTAFAESETEPETESAAITENIEGDIVPAESTTPETTAATTEVTTLTTEATVLVETVAVEKTKEAASAITVSFTCDPAELVLSVYAMNGEEKTLIETEIPFVYELLPGDYAYTASCEGYETVAVKPFQVIESGNAQKISVTLQTVVEQTTASAEKTEVLEGKESSDKVVIHTGFTWEDPEGTLNADGALELTEPTTLEQIRSMLPQALTLEDGTTAELIGWVSQDFSENTAGSYMFTAELSENTIFAETAMPRQIPVIVQQLNPSSSDVQTEESRETSEGAVPVYSEFTWVDPEGMLSDGVLDLPGVSPDHQAGFDDIALLLPQAILLTEDKKVTIDHWECPEFIPDAEGLWPIAGDFTFQAILSEEILFAGEALQRAVTVRLGGEAAILGLTVTYDDHGTEKTVENAIAIDQNTTILENGWYVVNSNVTIQKRIETVGDVNLILADGFALNAKTGVCVGGYNSLTIWGQSAGSGRLDAFSIWADAAIGGDQNEAAGNIVIHGGTVNASLKGDYSTAAAIGHGDFGTDGTVTITGGTVNAKASGIHTDIGIGGYFSTGAEGNAHIKATSILDQSQKKQWSGIIEESSDVMVGGKQTIHQNMTTSYNQSFTLNQGAVLTIPKNVTLTINRKFLDQGGEILVYGTLILPDNYPQSQTENIHELEGGILQIGAGAARRVDAEYLDTKGAVQTANAQIITSTFYELDQDWYLLDRDLNIPDRMEVGRDVNLILADGVSLTLPAGMHVGHYSSLTIWGQSSGSGKLTAVCQMSESGAAIGGNSREDCGSITIHGGTVSAELSGKFTGAAIGGGNYGAGGTITITGGTVNASTSGAWAGAAIGGGNESDGGIITITGGTVNAKVSGNEAGAGIGGGYNGNGGKITISGGSVTAKDSSGGAGIGGGASGNGGIITITGGTVNAGTQYQFPGAGIGGGCYAGNSGIITITGGTVNAESNGDFSGAGIGGGSRGAGVQINITGGTVNAKANGSWSGAGIGGGGDPHADINAGGEITISGGNVTASGGDGAGIGGGAADADGGTITITGGIVMAEGKRCVGIHGGNGGSFSTGAEGKAIITTNSIKDQTQKDSWSGILSEDSGKTYTVYKQQVLTENMSLRDVNIVETAHLTISSGVILTVSGTLNAKGLVQNQGTLDFGALAAYEDCAEMIKDGTVTVLGQPVYNVTCIAEQDNVQYNIGRYAVKNTDFTFSAKPKEGYELHVSFRVGENGKDTRLAGNGNTYTIPGSSILGNITVILDVFMRPIPIYRLYNPYTSEHLLCNDENEKNRLLEVGWSLDGVAWHSPSEGATVYRLYNPYDGSHLYTLVQSEIDRCLKLGWKMDGPVSHSAGEDGIPIYRLFNPYAKAHYHMYTVNQKEIDQLTSLGWKLEGIAWYAAK